MRSKSTWFQRAVDAPPPADPPGAWRYNAPTTDSVRASTSVLTAAATTVLFPGKKITRRRKKEESAPWVDEAWEMYNLVGELRYVSNAIAARMGAARLYVEVNGEEDEEASRDSLLDAITDQIVERAGLNLFVGGGCWFAGVARPDETTGEDEIEWLVLSSQEFKDTGTGRQIEIRGEKVPRDQVHLVRVWDPHPAKWTEADSPVRAALPILRELVGLTQHVSAQIDSRLAGAGVYWLPNTILQSAKVPEPVENAQTFDSNPVLNAIMTAMLLPIEDRSNASALVPLLLGAPDESISKIRFDSFATPFDENTKDLREEALRRLGLSLDAPPELLQGMGEANHWGMWLVRDETITAHVAPRLALIADALTTGWYRPIKEQQRENGTFDGDPDALTLRFDVSGLVQRPNRLSDALQLHAAGVVWDKALREAGHFDETDAPSPQEKAIALALRVGESNPQLLDNLSEVYSHVKALLDGTPETGVEAVESQREPGSLRPAVPGAPVRSQRPTARRPVPPAAGGSPADESEPASGPPV